MDIPTTAVLDRELDRVKSKVFLGNNAAFLGPLMCSLEFVWCNEIPTSDTNGITIRWNPEDFMRCTPDERVSSLLHELGHVYRLHPIRIGNRCPDVWNIACDIALNRDLVAMGYTIGVDWIGIHPEIPFELEEQIYDHLNKMGAPQHMPGHTCGGLIPLDPAGKQVLVNNVVKATYSAHMSGQPGSIPGGVESILNEFLKPKVPWEKALYLFFNDLLDEDYSWRRPNRRFEDMYLPSRFVDEGRLEHLIYYFDVSASVSDKMVTRFNSEVKYIWDTFKPVKLSIVQFDTRIQSETVLEDGDSFTELKVNGRGGTNLEPVRVHMMENKATAAIVFSDMECLPMEPGPECPIIWICVGSYQHVVNFGTQIRIAE